MEVVIDNKPVSMEIDTGVGPSLVSEATFKALWPDRALSGSTVRLRTYSGEPITVLGTMNADVQYKEQNAQLPLLVVQCDGPSFVGLKLARVLAAGLARHLLNARRSASSLTDSSCCRVSGRVRRATRIRSQDSSRFQCSAMYSQSTASAICAP